MLVRISIHAPLTGSDRFIQFACYILPDFNPRSPYGERLDLGCNLSDGRRFQSTLPLRGATIKITATLSDGRLFQSTLPLRGATSKSSFWDGGSPLFQSTLPLRGATCSSGRHTNRTTDFNPRSPYGERLQDCTKFYLGFCLSSTIL